jgi:hypothetical protein
MNCFDQSPPLARPKHYVQRLPYASASNPAIHLPFSGNPQRATYARPIVGHQLTAGVSTVIAPYFYAGLGQLVAIDESLRMGTIAATLLPPGATQPVWTGVAVHASWLHGAQLTQLLGQLRRYKPDTLCLQIATGQGSSRPWGDQTALDGLKQLITQVNSDGGRVVLGRRFSSGLLMVGLGAAGWSTGYAGTLQDFPPPPTTPAKPGGQGADWYYVPKLLNSVRVGTRARLVAAHPTIFAPSTQYDAALFATNPLLGAISTAAQRQELHRHNLFALRDQTRILFGLSPAARHTQMKNWVTTAQAHYTSISTAWAPGENDAFLSAWKAVV